MSLNYSRIFHIFTYLSVVVPIDPSVEPYTISNCVFDFAKYKEKDVKDDKANSIIILYYLYILI